MNFINEFRQLVSFLENRPSQAMSVAPIPEIDQRIQRLISSTPSALSYIDMEEVNRLKAVYEATMDYDTRIDEAIARIKILAQ